MTGTDHNGKQTTYAYDDAERLTSVTDAASAADDPVAYDDENNLCSITDANNHAASSEPTSYCRLYGCFAWSNFSETT
jgi:uncharacterized protein RhaS with RHS repeats